MIATNNGSALAVISRARLALDKAISLDEIRDVENLAQRARDLAKAAGMRRDAINSAARIALDARRKAGAMLAAMRKRGELVEGARVQLSQRATVTLADLNLTRSQSSRYQQEASVPQSDYERWAQAVAESADGVLSAAGLRREARRLAKAGESDDAAGKIAADEARLRRCLARYWHRAATEDRARLPRMLRAMADEFDRAHNLSFAKPKQRGRRKRTK